MMSLWCLWCHSLCLNTFEMFTVAEYLQELFKLRFQLLHHGFCFVKASTSLLHFKPLQEINQSFSHHNLKSFLVGPLVNLQIQTKEKNPMIIVMLLYSERVTFVLERCSWEAMWACTEDADVDKKMLQAAQWKISIFVMWSFSWRADKTKNSLHLGFVWNKRYCDKTVHVFQCYLPWSTLSSMARLHWRLLYSMTSYRNKNVYHHPDTLMCQLLFVFLWYI